MIQIVSTKLRLPQLSVALCCVLLAVACANNDPKPGEKFKESPGFADIDARINGELTPEKDVEASQDDRTVERFRGTGEFINTEVARRRPSAALSEDGEITFNFEALPVQDVVRAILGDLLGVNYVIAPGVSGEVTFATAKPLNREQVMPILEMLLRWNNAALVVRGDQHLVVPVNNAIPGNLTPRLGNPASVKGFEVLAVPLSYISPAQMQILLEPYIRDGAIISADNSRSLMVLSGSRSELQNYLQTIEIFDVDWLEGMSVGVFPLERVETSEIVPELEAIFGDSADSPLAGLFRFIEIERLNSVLVITPQPEYLDKAEDWIQRLDRGAGTGASNRLYVYRVENLEAAVLADYLVDIFGGQRGGSQRRENNDGRITAGSLGGGLEPVSLSTVNQGADNDITRNSRPAPQSNSDNADGLALSEDNENIAITAVEETNSLLIQSTPSQYNNILSAIKRLDVEPLQVLIEAHILQVSLNEALEFGVNYFLSNFDPNADGVVTPTPTPAPGDGDGDGDGGDVSDSGAAGTTASGATFLDSPGFVSRAASLTGSTSLLSFVSNPLVAGAGFFSAVVTALESVSEVRTISSPSLLVRNNTEATINVGTQLAIANTTFNGVVGGGTGTTASTQFIQTGTTLTVTPRVNPGGLVYLQLDQEVSGPSAAGAPGGATGPNGNPNISTNNLTTDVAVQSGQSIILGGLISDTYTESEGGVPFLRRIPWLGRLFETTTQSSARTEVVIIVKPTVIEAVDNLQKVSDDLRKSFQALRPFKRPITLPNEEIPRKQSEDAL